MIIEHNFISHNQCFAQHSELLSLLVYLFKRNCSKCNHIYRYVIVCALLLVWDHTLICQTTLLVVSLWSLSNYSSINCP